MILSTKDEESSLKMEMVAMVLRGETCLLANHNVDDNFVRFFGGDINAVPKQALTVGVGTVMDAR